MLQAAFSLEPKWALARVNIIKTPNRMRYSIARGLNSASAGRMQGHMEIIELQHQPLAALIEARHAPTPLDLLD